MLPETMSWFQDSLSTEYKPMFVYLVCQAIFLTILCVCLCLVIRGRLSRISVAPTSRDSKAKIKAIFQNRKTTLAKLVKDLEVARLEDGYLRFNNQSQEAEEELFKFLNETRKKLSKTESKSQEVTKILKLQFMKYPQDIQGGRRLQTVLEIYKNCESDQYRPSGWSKFKRLVSIPTSFSFFTIKWQTLLFCGAIPLLVIFFDMLVSDTLVLNDAYDMYNDCEGSMCWILSTMVDMLTFYYAFSLFSMFYSPFVFSLRTAYYTGMRIRDTSEEQDETFTPLAAICRYDCSLDESGSETGMQSALQWSFYLVLQLVTGDTIATEREEFRFKRLVFSGCMSTLSLTLGQFKANKLLSESQTTLRQQICYFLACFTSTFATQLLIISCIVFWCDVTMAYSWYLEKYGHGYGHGISRHLTWGGFVIFYVLLSGIRLYAIHKKFKSTSVLMINEGYFGYVLIPRFLLSGMSIQPLHLQSSKTRITSPSKTYFPGLDWEEYFLKENIISHIILTLLSVGLFIGSHIIIFHATSSTQVLLYSDPEFKARGNFLMIASFCIPICWVLSQVFVWLFFHWDLGSLTCGLTYEFDNKVSPTTLLQRSCLCLGCPCAEEGGAEENVSIFSKLTKKLSIWWRKVEFVSENGRWVDPSE